MMKRKDLLIAAIVIAFSLIMLFLLFELLFASLKVSVNELILEITPLSTGIIDKQFNDQSLDFQQATQVPGVFSVGYTIKIVDTGGDGLRIRIEPGLEKTAIFLGDEGEKFKIIEGPSINDNKVWWKIQGENDSARTGWAVQEYLEVIE